jgi:hypothetical protein
LLCTRKPPCTASMNEGPCGDDTICVSICCVGKESVMGERRQAFYDIDRPAIPPRTEAGPWVSATNHYSPITTFLIDTLAIRNALNPFRCIADVHSNRHSSGPLKLHHHCAGSENRSRRGPQPLKRGAKKATLVGRGCEAKPPRGPSSSSGSQDDDGSAGLTTSSSLGRQRAAFKFKCDRGCAGASYFCSAICNSKLRR